MSLSTNNVSDARAWFNKLDVPVPFDNQNLIVSVIKHYKEILQLVEKHNNLNTLRKNLYSLSKFCKLAGEEEKYHALSSRYIQLGKEIRENNLSQERTPKQEAKEISFDEMVKLREFYYPDRLKNLRDNYSYLVMAMVTLEPPKRLEIANMKINELDISANFLIQNKKGEWVMVINKDKVSKIKFFQDNNTFLLSDELSEIITESLKYFPRLYLFSDNKFDKPLGNAGLIYLMKSITPNGSTNNDFRSAYITHFYNEKHNLREKNELAIRMRHSSGTAELNYNKI